MNEQLSNNLRNVSKMRSSYIIFEKHVASKMSTSQITFELYAVSKMSISRLTFKKGNVSKMRACWLTFKKSMHFRYKYISFSNLSLFASEQFWVHDVLKNKLFWLNNKNPVLTVHFLQVRVFYFLDHHHEHDSKKLSLWKKNLQDNLL